MTLTPQTDLAVAQALLSLKAEIDRLKAERDRLRDIVKRLSHFVSDTACFTPSDKAVSQSLIREARAAIGEDKP